MAFTDPFPGLEKPLNKQNLISAIRLDIAAEQEAAFLYQSHAQACKDGFPGVAEALRDIASEEIVHTGELTEILQGLDLDESALLSKGRQEIMDKYPNLSYKVR
jgi:rubrerythrin